jgi:hypothetical protein
MPLKNKEAKKKYDTDYQKKWCQKNREKVRAYSKKYREKHPERFKEYERRAAIWRKENPEKVREYAARAQRRHILKKYSITEDEYDEMSKKQNGLCAICGGVSPTRLAVDHCHKTEKVRGLLCSRCNVGIGMFLDNTDIMNKAILYIKSAGL